MALIAQGGPEAPATPVHLRAGARRTKRARRWPINLSLQRIRRWGHDLVQFELNGPGRLQAPSLPCCCRHAPGQAAKEPVESEETRKERERAGDSAEFEAGFSMQREQKAALTFRSQLGIGRRARRQRVIDEHCKLERTPYSFTRVLRDWVGEGDAGTPRGPRADHVIHVSRCLPRRLLPSHTDTHRRAIHCSRGAVLVLLLGLCVELHGAAWVVCGAACQLRIKQYATQ